jgi:phosphoenolpyruvate carboxylase
MNAPCANVELRRPVRFLRTVLIRVLKAQARLKSLRPPVLQYLFSTLTEDGGLSGSRHLLEVAEKLGLESIGGIIRVCNYYFSLLNIAEESYYLGRRRLQEAGLY